MKEDLKVINKDHEREAFEEEKLYCSVYYPAREADISESEADRIAEKVVYETKAWISEHDDVVTTTELREKVLSILERLDRDVRVMYETHLDLN